MKQLWTTLMLPHSLNLCTMGYHLRILSKLLQHINPLNIHALHSHFLYNPHNPTFEHIMPHQKHSHISKYNFLSLNTKPFNKKQYDPKVLQTPIFLLLPYNTHLKPKLYSLMLCYHFSIKSKTQLALEPKVCHHPPLLKLLLRKITTYNMINSLHCSWLMTYCKDLRELIIAQWKDKGYNFLKLTNAKCS